MLRRSIEFGLCDGSNALFSPDSSQGGAAMSQTTTLNAIATGLAFMFLGAVVIGAF
ncbi:MAG: hypothetical protein M3145_10965 [Pseudomonadota bacterium]|nr:hypothetical protein [Pseudomonadota bacterium]